MSRNIELGDLIPLREVLERVDERIKQTETVQADHPSLSALGDVRRWLSAALDEATNGDMGVGVAELAEAEGVSRWAIYKRIQRGQLAARKRAGHIRISLDSAAA